jgi:poly-gamma-glutamate synthesis protein (capsule biosynthesis protein)
MLFTFLALTPQSSPASDDKVRINFVGDVMLADGPGETIERGGDPLKNFDELFRSGDFTIGNLECPISTKGKEKEGKPVTFQAHPRVVEVLKKRFYGLALSNNHSGDFGPESLLETISHLDQAGLRHFGGGKNLKDAHEPLWIEHKGMKIAILGYNEFMPRSFEAGPNWPGIAWSEDSHVISDMRRAREAGADLVIPFLHWGWEYEAEPNRRQITFAHTLIDNGADMVIGGHPHVTQGVATYKRKPIVWSLGNFVFDGFPEGPRRWGWFLQITADRKGVESYRIVPAHLSEDGTPTPDLTASAAISWMRER